MGTDPVPASSSLRALLAVRALKTISSFGVARAGLAVATIGAAHKRMALSREALRNGTTVTVEEAPDTAMERIATALGTIVSGANYICSRGIWLRPMPVAAQREKKSKDRKQHSEYGAPDVDEPFIAE